MTNPHWSISWPFLSRGWLLNWFTLGTALLWISRKSFSFYLPDIFSHDVILLSAKLNQGNVALQNDVPCLPIPSQLSGLVRKSTLILYIHLARQVGDRESPLVQPFYPSLVSSSSLFPCVTWLLFSTNYSFDQASVTGGLQATQWIFTRIIYTVKLFHQTWMTTKLSKSSN